MTGWQMALYSGLTIVAVAALELSCHLLFMHALAVTGSWEEMGRLRGFAIEGWSLVSMALLSIFFLALKVHQPLSAMHTALLPSFTPRAHYEHRSNVDCLGKSIVCRLCAVEVARRCISN